MVKLERAILAIILAALVAGFIYIYGVDLFVADLFGGH